MKEELYGEFSLADFTLLKLRFKIPTFYELISLKIYCANYISFIQGIIEVINAKSESISIKIFWTKYLKSNKKFENDYMIHGLKQRYLCYLV